MRTARVRVRRTGTAEWPWESRCSDCFTKTLHFAADGGVVAANTRGLGNRTHAKAMEAAYLHLAKHHGSRS